MSAGDARENERRILAVRACRSAKIIHNEPMPVTPGMVVDASRALV